MAVHIIIVCDACGIAMAGHPEVEAARFIDFAMHVFDPSTPDLCPMCTKTPDRDEAEFVGIATDIATKHLQAMRERGKIQ